jgi:hypothetical protein
MIKRHTCIRNIRIIIIAPDEQKQKTKSGSTPIMSYTPHTIYQSALINQAATLTSCRLVG